MMNTLEIKLWCRRRERAVGRTDNSTTAGVEAVLTRSEIWAKIRRSWQEDVRGRGFKEGARTRENTLRQEHVWNVGGTARRTVWLKPTEERAERWTGWGGRSGADRTSIPSDVRSCCRVVSWVTDLTYILTWSLWMMGWDRHLGGEGRGRTTFQRVGQQSRQETVSRIRVLAVEWGEEMYSEHTFSLELQVIVMY